MRLHFETRSVLLSPTWKSNRSKSYWCLPTRKTANLKKIVDICVISYLGYKYNISAVSLNKNEGKM